MSEIETIRQAAHERGRQLNLPYAGALRPQEAFRLIQAGARLVDVRTQAELYWVGQVPGALWVEWNGYPGGVPNRDFVGQLAALADKGDVDQVRSIVSGDYIEHASYQADGRDASGSIAP